VNPSFEVLLVFGIWAFYLYDSAMLLYFNELTFSKSSGDWKFAYSTSKWTIRGRTPYLPNPLTPWKPLFRPTWSANDQFLPLGSDDNLTKLIEAIRPVGYFVTVLLLEMVVGLPLVLLTLGTGTWFFITLASIYLTIVVALVVAYRKRDSFGLTGKDLVSVAFDSIACPPFAINLVRKITLRHVFRMNPIEFALQHFKKERFYQLASAIQLKIDEELELVDVDSPVGEALKAYRNQLSELAA
jgi:hypothetical protein